MYRYIYILLYCISLLPFWPNAFRRRIASTSASLFVAMLADHDPEEIVGPLPLPGDGTGFLSASERDAICQRTGCSAAVRERSQWGPGRFITVKGPRSQLAGAQGMADAFVLAKQQSDAGPRAPEDWMNCFQFCFMDIYIYIYMMVFVSICLLV